MEIENQVCTLAQAKKLDYLGIVSKSYMYHVYPHMNSGWKVLADGMFDKADDAVEFYPAFSVAELGVMLPDGISTNSNIRTAEIVIRKDCLNDWTVAYDVDHVTEGGYGATVKEIYRDNIVENKSEATCRADMLIHLLENNLTTAAECNEHLNSN